MAQNRLFWQSKTVLLLVLPFVAASVVLQIHYFWENLPQTAIWTLGLTILFAFVVWQLRAGTAGAAFAGALITADLMFSTAAFPYKPWRTALLPVLAVFLLSFVATRLGRAQKERLGIGEERKGRTASQITANLGIAAVVSNSLVQTWMIDSRWFASGGTIPATLAAIGLGALAEAGADTVSSEIGQVLGGKPRMITTFRVTDPGTDGGITLIGTVAGIFAAAVVALTGTWALGGGAKMLAIGWGGGVFGLFFDSLLGATLERRGWLNNDAVNFLSTGSAAVFAATLVAL